MPRETRRSLSSLIQLSIYGWPIGFSHRPREAKAFYATIAVATLVGMGLTFTAIDAIKALYWSAVINGVVAVPVMVSMMLAASRADILGPFAITGWLKGLGWVATAVMGAAVAGMLFTSV